MAGSDGRKRPDGKRGEGEEPPMKPRRFDYVRPDSADEAVAVLAEYGDDASVLAGGQSLVALVHFRLAEPAGGLHLPSPHGTGHRRRARPQNLGRRPPNPQPA